MSQIVHNKIIFLVNNFRIQRYKKAIEGLPHSADFPLTSFENSLITVYTLLASDDITLRDSDAPLRSNDMKMISDDIALRDACTTLRDACTYVTSDYISLRSDES